MALLFNFTHTFKIKIQMFTDPLSLFILNSTDYQNLIIGGIK